MGETDSLPTARESMARAVAAAESGRFELAQTWVAIARELREGARPAAPQMMPGKARQVPAPRPFERGSAGDDVQLMTRPHDDPSAAVIGDPDNDADTMYGYTRGQQRPPSQTAYAAAVRTRKQLDRGEGPYSGSVVADVSSLVDEILTRMPKAELDETIVAAEAFGSEGLQQVARVLRSMDDHPQRWVTGEPETEEQRAQRFAYAPPARPYVDPETTFAGFARGAQEHTGVLSGGRPGECRNCGHAIYEVTPSDLGTSHRFRHEGTGQAMCPTPPRHTNEAGEETYVTGPHLYAEPGGLPYRAE